MEQSVTGLALIVIRLVRQMALWLLAWPHHHHHTSRLGPAGWENILTEILKYFTLDKYLNILIISVCGSGRVKYNHYGKGLFNRKAARI